MGRRNFLRAMHAALVGSAMVLSVGSVSAQAFPSRPVKVIVPFAAGGGADVLMRLVGQKMSASLGQPIVIENLPGAGTILGAQKLESSAPDGYTLLVGTPSTVMTNPHLYKKLPYNPADFVPVTLLANQAFIVGINPGLPARNFAEFVQYARANPKKLNYATSGRGGAAHIVGEMFENALGLDMADVPYKGSGPALTDLMGGQVQVAFDGGSTIVAFSREGRIRALAVTSEKRSPIAPDVPTVVELGYPNLVIQNRYFLLAPKGTPAAAVARLNEAAVAALNDPDVRSQLAKDGTIAEPTTPEGLARILKTDGELWGGTIKRLGIQLD
jgi:tripartite-type tricarboxylate transporter receptor subunit TctC